MAKQSLQMVVIKYQNNGNVLRVVYQKPSIAEYMNRYAIILCSVPRAGYEHPNYII